MVVLAEWTRRAEDVRRLFLVTRLFSSAALGREQGFAVMQGTSLSPVGRPWGALPYVHTRARHCALSSSSSPPARQLESPSCFGLEAQSEQV